MTKQSLIRGTLILTLAALISRVLGVAQRIPLQRILGDEGMATYGIAYNIYGILLIIATVGIPSALSKQIAEYHAVGRYHEAHQTYLASRNFSLVAGFFAAVFLYAVAPYYAVHISHDPEAVLSIRAIAPALLVFPLISIMRGYFQGLQFMSPTGLSQISEQILRVGTAVLLPLVLLHFGYSREVAVAGASFGAVAGSVGAIGIMMYFYWSNRKIRASEMKQQGSFVSLARKEIYKKLLKTAIPISLASITIPFIYFIDSSTVIALLKGDMGADNAKNMLGILTGRAQSLAGIPPILAIALSSAVLPAVASAFSKKDMKQVRHMSSLSLRLTLLTGAPVALYLTASAFSVNGFLFGNTEGSWVIAALCLGSIFQIMMMTSMSILQGMGNVMLPMWFVFAGVGLKGICNFLFTPLLGIYGVILATSAAFILILVLNLRVIHRKVSLQMMGSRWVGFLLASLGMVVAIGLVEMGLTQALPSAWPATLVHGLICLITAIIGFAVYAACLLWGKGILEEDLKHLPHRFQRLLFLRNRN